MSRIPDQSKLSLWSQRFNRFHNSGLSIARFCARENIPTHSFYYWAKRVGPRSQQRQTQAIDSTVDLAISPPGQPVANTHDASSVRIHGNQHLKLEVPAHCLEQVIVRSQLQSQRV